MTKVKIPALLLVSILAAGVSVADDCPIERARYQLMADPEYTAGFELKPTVVSPDGELVFFVASAKSAFTYRFRLNFGNGFTTLSMTPLAAMQSANSSVGLNDLPVSQAQAFQPLFLIKQDLTFLESELAVAGLAAPMYVFPSALAPELWYHSEAYGNPHNIRESMTRSFFKFVACSRA
ncbi:hypothetical protein [Methylomonas rosea]|uniref:Uncharacterized protein n=1 Tax=Methylomonas rosea TaxID=2952227 RepID=A0ABT1TPA5_9GAMM|nr:hypothetical protein [Methylomonas sp. WSC-7]MCQ8116312.1 hypothetical protein [Methylomonas sp. WSC-7]